MESVERKIRLECRLSVGALLNPKIYGIIPAMMKAYVGNPFLLLIRVTPNRNSDCILMGR